LKGSTAIFAVTDFFEPFAASGTDPEAAQKVEFKQGENIANAANKTATLKHLIWSTLPNAVKISNGKTPVPHFDAKAKVDEYIKSIPSLLAKTTFLSVTFYASVFVFPMYTPNLLVSEIVWSVLNLSRAKNVQKSSGKYVQLQPTPADVPMSSIGDASVNVGIFALSILKQPQLTHGRYVLGAIETTTAGGFLEIFTKATGKPSAYVQTASLEDFDNVWPNWARLMGLMMIFFDQYRGEKVWGAENYLTQEDLGISEGLVSIHDALKTLDWSFL